MGEQSLFTKQFSRHTRKCHGIGRRWTWLARVQNMNLRLSTDVGISSTDASSLSFGRWGPSGRCPKLPFGCRRRGRDSGLEKIAREKSALRQFKNCVVHPPGPPPARPPGFAAPRCCRPRCCPPPPADPAAAHSLLPAHTQKES